jgi:hypothetical protein
MLWKGPYDGPTLESDTFMETRNHDESDDVRWSEWMSSFGGARERERLTLFLLLN